MIHVRSKTRMMLAMIVTIVAMIFAAFFFSKASPVVSDKPKYGFLYPALAGVCIIIALIAAVKTTRLAKRAA